MNPPALWRPTEGFISQRYHPSHRNVSLIGDLDSPCSTASPAMEFFDDDVLELVPGMLDLRLLVSGLRIGAILSLWQEKLQDESRGRVFRPIRARKHQRPEKKDRRERKRGSVSTPQPPTPYKMKDFYLPGYQPPDFPGALGTTPPREADPEVEEEMSPEGSPEQHETGHRSNISNTTTNTSKDGTETQFRSSRDRTRKFMDCFITESRTLWKKAGSNLNELLESSTECVFLSYGLEISLDRGFKAIVKFLQGEISNSLEDVCSLILLSSALISVSKAQRTIEDDSMPSDCDLQFWRDALDESERTAFDSIIKSIYGPIGSFPQECGTVQTLSKETLESTSLYPLLVRCLRGMEHLGEAFLNLSSRNAEDGVSATLVPVNPMFQKFLDGSRPDFVETVLQAIRDDLSGKLLFLEALSRPAKELLTIGALPTLRAFEGYVLGVARVYIADLADYKTFVRGFMKFCLACSSKILDMFMKKKNEEPYSNQYCKSKVELELSWFKSHLTKAAPSGIGSATASAIMKELGFDSEDTTRPKFASYMKRDYKDVGNMLALPELLWSENGSIQVEVDDEEEDDAEASNSLKPLNDLSVAIALKPSSENVPEMNPPPSPPPPLPLPPPAPPPVLAGATESNSASDLEMIDYTSMIPSAAVSDERNAEVNDTKLLANAGESALSQTINEAPAAPQEARTSSKRKSWGTDLVSDLVTKKRKGLQTTCDICGISLSLNPAGTSKSNLIRHAATHDKSTQYVCTVEGCNKAFGRKDNLTRHMRKVHES